MSDVDHEMLTIFITLVCVIFGVVLLILLYEYLSRACRRRNAQIDTGLPAYSARPDYSPPTYAELMANEANEDALPSYDTLLADEDEVFMSSYNRHHPPPMYTSNPSVCVRTTSGYVCSPPPYPVNPSPAPASRNRPRSLTTESQPARPRRPTV